jgi:hypothetical protein
MTRTFLNRLLTLGTVAAVAGCCGSVSCNCQDGAADAVTIRFDLDSLNRGFSSAEVDSVYIRRIARDTAQHLAPDSVLLVRPRSTAAQPIILNNARPLAANGTRKLSDYRYILRLPTPRKVPATGAYKRYFIDQIELDGNFQADGCCTCYQNTEKIVYFNNRAYNQTTPGQEDTVVLSRR